MNNKILLKLMAVCFISILFPIGIWLGLEGYELWALMCLLVGWSPIMVVILMHFYREGYI